MMLCDYADTAGGKLNLLGAGWGQVLAEAPASVALGILVTVPWDRTNEVHTLQVELVDEDGHRVSAGEPAEEVVNRGRFETGRPAGVPAGSGLVIPLAIRWPVLPLPAGGYSFVLQIDEIEEARVTFRAREL